MLLLPPGDMIQTLVTFTTCLVGGDCVGLGVGGQCLRHEGSRADDDLTRGKQRRDKLSVTMFRRSKRKVTSALFKGSTTGTSHTHDNAEQQANCQLLHDPVGISVTAMIERCMFYMIVSGLLSRLMGGIARM